MAGTYRNYLQALADNGDNVANALLQVVGDDQRVNDVFQRSGVNIGSRGQQFSKQQINDYNNQYGSVYSSGNRPAESLFQEYFGGGSTGGGGGRTAAPAASQDVSFLSDQEKQLRDLLNRTETGLQQGLARNEDEYNRNVGQSNADKERKLAGYQDQRVAQNKGKLDAYDTVNKNANTGYRSLAQIIGRASGTGSSAFRDLLPNVIGTDTSSRRRDVTETFGENLAGIDKAQSQFEIDFQSILDDLVRQKKENEENLRSGVETQRQGINAQLATNAGQLAQARGGGYAQVRAAQAPYQDAINNSRNTVEGFFNQFRTQFAPRQAVAATPELDDYTVDRANINAQQQSMADPNNPYAQLLRKRLQGQM